MTQLQHAGVDLVAVSFNDDGTATNTWSDGTETTTPASTSVLDRQRARSVAAQTFLKRKRRQWPTPRI